MEYLVIDYKMDVNIIFKIINKVTPPMKSCRKNRFRKPIKNQLKSTMPSIIQEVRSLIESDSVATSISIKILLFDNKNSS